MTYSLSPFLAVSIDRSLFFFYTRMLFDREPRDLLSITSESRLFTEFDLEADE